VRAYVHTYDTPATISNWSNNCGTYYLPEKLIPLLRVNALHGKALPMYCDGHWVRDWLFVEDQCRVIAQILLADVAARLCWRGVTNGSRRQRIAARYEPAYNYASGQQNRLTMYRHARPLIPV
jgi:dTDP-D-glucose 4,6-dehydratase